MKIFIVGATYSNNFGDMLFSKLVLKRVSKKAQCRFNITSDYCADFVGRENLSDFKKSKADALLYMPGGYLGDRHDTSLYTTLLWFLRYFPWGIYYAIKKKPIMIMAVDAGPCKYWIMRKIIKFICKRVQKLIVRNPASKEFLVSIGVKTENILVTSDYAQIMKDEEIVPVESFDKFKEKCQKKLLYVHVNVNQRVADVVIPAVERFYNNHKDEYSLVVASDQVCANDSCIYEKIKEFAKDDVYYYKYGDPLELCYIIKNCDTVITYKLHAGIVSAAYSKSVIAIPEHYLKVEKYYQQIGEGGRVLPLHMATTDGVYELLEKYHSIPICLSDEILNLVYDNNIELDGFLNMVGK